MAQRDNLIATYQNNPTLQSQYTQQQYLDLFDFGQSTPQPAPNPPPTRTPPVENIIGQNLNQGGGDGGIQGLQQTFTRTQPRAPKFDPNINPAFTLTGKGRLDPMGSDIDYFQSFRAQNDPRAFTSGLSIDKIGSDSRYFEEPSMFNKGITGIKNFFTDNRFFQPKVRGTLGTRLANQPRLPLPLSVAAYSRSPFNSASKQFNPAFEGQLNYLEGQDGFIGRDQQSGGLKYGPESVLSGQNVISLFGTNDYLGQLNKYQDKVTARYGKLVDKFGKESDEATKYYDQFVQKVIDEKKGFTDSTIYKAQQEEIKKQKEKEFNDRLAAEAATAARARARNASVYASADRQGFTNRDGGFSTSAADKAGTSEGSGQFSPSSSRGRSGYDDGGRVYLYHRLK